MATDLIARGLASKALSATVSSTEPVDTVTFEQFGATGSGNDQPAIQAAIDYAAANAIPRVVGRHKAYELWEPLLDDPDGSGAAWFARNRTLRIPACETIEIDFNGAVVTLKGPAGGPALPGQPIVDTGSGPNWSGGFITVTGKITSLRIANVTATAGFAGNALVEENINLFNKGFVCQDIIGMGRVTLDNVTLHGFGGEIMYDNCASLLIARDCHFYNSPQSCWNPNGTGRVVAYNLRAGRSAQVAEIRGGVGHDYFGGEFYEGGGRGITVIGGPDPQGGSQNGYNEPVRRPDAGPPWVTFHGTRFADIGGSLAIGSYARGKIETIDTAVFIAAAFASAGIVRDIDLEVVAWCDRRSAYDAVFVGGASANDGSVPHSINLTIRCGRTQLAKTNYAYISHGLGMTGFVDPESCTAEVSGCAASAFNVHTPTGATAPLVRAERFTSYLKASNLGVTGDMTVVPHARQVRLYPETDGIHSLGIDNLDHGHTNGQRIRYLHAGGANRLIRFPRGGAGMVLPADRLLRGACDYIDLQYHNGVWCEGAFSGVDNPVTVQGGTAYTPGVADADSTIRFTSASPVTVTLPPSSAVRFPVGTAIGAWQDGAGQVSFAAGTGVTLDAAGGSLAVASRHAIAYATKVADDRWTIAPARVPLPTPATPAYVPPPPPPAPTPTPTPGGTTLIDTTRTAAGFKAAPWNSNSLSATAAGVPGPDGTGEATLLQSTATFFTLRDRVSPGPRLFRATFKAGTAPFVWLYADGPDYAIRGVWCDLAAGTIAANTFDSATITPLADGWYRIEARVTVWPGDPSDAGYIGFGLANASGGYGTDLGRTALIHEFSLFLVN